MTSIFGIPELRAMVFRCFDLKQLFVCTMVCRTWRDTVLGDARLRQRMFLSPVPDVDDLMAIEELHEKRLCGYRCEGNPLEPCKLPDAEFACRAKMVVVNPLLSADSDDGTMFDCHLTRLMRFALADILGTVGAALLGQTTLVGLNVRLGGRRKLWHEISTQSWLSLYLTQPPIYSVAACTSWYFKGGPHPDFPVIERRETRPLQIRDVLDLLTELLGSTPISSLLSEPVDWFDEHYLTLETERDGDYFHLLYAFGQTPKDFKHQSLYDYIDIKSGLDVDDDEGTVIVEDAD